MLTIRQLQFFEALARERHFRRAAEAVNITQPALSAQIMEMEARLGTSLVERSRGGVTLTPVGKQLLPKAQAILHQMQELTEMAVHTPGPLSGTLEIGMIPTVAPYLLPKLLPSVQSAFPSLNLKVREAVTEQLVADLKAGKLTAVIAAKPIHDTSLREIELFDDPFFIAAGTNTNDVVSSPATHDSVALERLLLLEDGHCLRDQALEACNAAGNRRLVNFGATSMTTLLQLVANGMGITLIPSIAVSAEAGHAKGIRLVPFKSPVPSRQICLFFRASSMRSTDFTALAERIRDTADRLLDTSDVRPAALA